MSIAADQHSRLLNWDACLNVRDLGGYMTRDGHETRWGALIRSDSVCRLSPVGIRALYDYGVRTIIDLRRADELADEPSPFAEPTPVTRGLTYRNIPLGMNASARAREHVRSATSRPDLYCRVLDHYQPGIAAVIRAIVGAPAGGVLVHCQAGKDRTGLIAALVLAVADVADDVIADDYALSAVTLQPVYDARLRQEPDPVRREVLAEQLGAVRETMLTVLAHLSDQHGGVVPYLAAVGVARDDIAQLRRRIQT